MYLILCIWSNHGLHLYQVSVKYLDWFQSDGADTISILIMTKGNISVKIVHGVTVFIVCKSSYHGHLFHSWPFASCFAKISIDFTVKWPTHFRYHLLQRA